MGIKIKYWLRKIKEIIYKIFLCLVHQFSLKFPDFSNFIDQQKQDQMYTLKTENLFIQCGSQNSGPQKGNKKSCLSDAIIIFLTQWLNEACLMLITPWLSKDLTTFCRCRKLLHWVYCTILVYSGDNILMLLHYLWTCDCWEEENTENYLEVEKNVDTAKDSQPNIN